MIACKQRPVVAWFAERIIEGGMACGYTGGLLVGSKTQRKWLKYARKSQSGVKGVEAVEGIW